MSDGSAVLARVPIAATAGWIARTVATDAPRLTKHQEYSLALHLSAEEPILVARIVEDGERALHSRDRVSAASVNVEQTVSFFPNDWRESDDVVISFGGIRTWVSDAALKEDPRACVAVPTFGGLSTGSLIRCATLSGPRPLRISVFAVARRDVEVNRSRWRLTQSCAGGLSPLLRFLATGRQSGEVSV